MKTTKLMTAFALSAMFAACSQDAELNEALAKNDFSNIPMVEASFTVNTDADVESRMAKQFGWELGDKIGFAWLNNDGTAAANHPLYCTDADNAAFQTHGMLYIGKYYAYMPYTEGNMTVEAIKFDVTGQPLTTNANDLAKHAIYISPKLTTLEKPDADGNVSEGNEKAGIGNNLPLEIARVSNAATINLTFENTGDMTDLKVYSVSLDAKVGSSQVLPTSFTYAPTGDANVTNKSWKGYSPYTFYQSTTLTAGAIKATSKDGLAVANDALTVYMLTMPRKSGENIENLEVVVSTNYGDVTVDLNSECGEDAEKCITFGKENNKDVTIATTSLFNDFAGKGTINVHVDMDTKAIANPTVKTQAELEAKLNMLATAGYEDPITITVNPESKNKAQNVVLTDFTLPEGLKSIVTLTTGANAANGFLFEGNSVINKQIVVGKNAAVNGTMTVAYLEDEDEEALLTLNGHNLTVNKDAVLVNNGKINANIITEAKSTTKAAGKYISNSEDAEQVGGSFTNNGEIQWIAGALPTIQGVAYAEATDLAGIKAANNAGVERIHLLDGTTINNVTETYSFANVGGIYCYGNVNFNITDTPSGIAQSVSFYSAVKLYVLEGAAVTVSSDNKDNSLMINTVIVAEGATFAAANINLPATITNEGTVTLNKVEYTYKDNKVDGVWNEVK